MMKTCFTSIDVEDGGVENLDKILDIFKKNNISVTLFITGEVLKRYGNLVKKWGNEYEIACHSFSHRFWTPPSRHPLNFEERKKELEDFIDIYQRIFNEKPKGFRAPSHLIDEEGMELLENQGFLYDSSIVPHYPFFKEYRGFKGKAPLLPYQPSIKNCREKGEMKILEIPVTGQIFGIPLAGTWIKKLPPFFYRILFTAHNPTFITLSLHSWDTLNPQVFRKLEKILKILKNKKYQFLNGEQIYKNRE